MPPLSPSSVLEVLQLLIRTPSVNPHIAPEGAGVASWIDAALFAAGSPTLNYGPAGEGAPDAVEGVDLDLQVNGAQALAETARRVFRA